MLVALSSVQYFVTHDLLDTKKTHSPLSLVSLLLLLLLAPHVVHSACTLDGEYKVNGGTTKTWRCDTERGEYVIPIVTGEAGVCATDDVRFKVYVLDTTNYNALDAGNEFACGYGNCGEWRTAWSRYVPITWSGSTWVAIRCEVRWEHNDVNPLTQIYSGRPDSQCPL